MESSSSGLLRAGLRLLLWWGGEVVRDPWCHLGYPPLGLWAGVGPWAGRSHHSLSLSNWQPPGWLS